MDIDKLIRDVLDIIIRDRLRNISLNSNTLQLSNISNEQVKYAFIDSK